MNKREFKKYADALGASVIDEMTSAYYNVAGIDRDKVAQAIEITLGAVGKVRSNSNVTFDRGPKAFENPTEYARTKTGFFGALSSSMPRASSAASSTRSRQSSTRR